MKPNHIRLACLTFSLFFFTALQAQHCQNTDFEDGNFSNWDGYTGSCCGGSINAPGVVPGRHTIITQNVPDPNTNNVLMMMPPVGGGAYSVRLGNDQVGSEAESLKRTFLVDASTQLFTYQYAVVLQDPEGHPPIDKPKFEVRVYDQSGTVVNPPQCGYYQVTAGPETDNWNQYSDVRYKDWSTVGIDLSAYTGTNITVEFTVQDCGWGGHYGYVYLDASCGFLDLRIIGFCTGSDRVTVVAPEGFDNYYWPHSGETTSSVEIPVPAEGDSIIVQVTNESGCSTSILHVFHELPLPNVVAGPDTLICLGQEVDIMGDGAGTGGYYSWTVDGLPYSEEQFFTVMPADSTTYMLSATNANGCSSANSTASVTVLVDADLLFSLAPDTTICSGKSVTLNGPHGTIAYHWTASGSAWSASSASVTVTPMLTTTYFLEVSNSSCSYIDSITITVEDGSTQPDTIHTEYCSGTTSLTLTGVNDYASYSWQTGQTGQVIVVNPTISNPIELQLVSSFGCLDSIIYVLDPSNGPVVTASALSDSICFGHSAVLSASGAGAGGSYTWTSLPAGFTGSGASVTDDPLTTTKYIVTGMSAAGCGQQFSKDTVTIYIDSSAYVSLGTTIRICRGDSVTLDSGSPAGTLEWYASTNLIGTTTSIRVAPSDDEYYYVYVYGPDCSYSDFVMVDVDPVNVFTIPVDKCIASNSVTVNVPGGYSSVFWPGFGNTALSNIVLNPVNHQIVPIYAQNNYGCTDTLNMEIVELPPSTLSVSGNITICYGATAVFSASSTYPSDQISWYHEDGSFLQAGSNVSVTLTNSETFYAVLTNGINCVTNPDTLEVHVMVLSDYLLNVPASYIVCPGEAVHLESPGTNGTFSWSYNGISSSDKEIDFIPNGSQTVTLTVTSGACSDNANISISVKTPVVYQVQVNPDPVCAGAQVSLTVSPAGTISSVKWYNGATVVGSSNPVNVFPAISTVYTVQITETDNCKTTATGSVTVNQYPVLNLGPDISACFGSTAVLFSKGPVSQAPYLWSTTETSESISVKTSGKYSLTVTENGCTSMDEVDVYFYPPSYMQEAPNVITPNGDGINDVLTLHYEGILEYHMAVTNRWGNLMFETNEVSDFWNGNTKQGEKVSDGVYFYKITYKLLCGDSPDSTYQIDGFVEVFGN